MLTSAGQKAVIIEITANKIKGTTKASGIEKSQAYGAID